MDKKKKTFSGRYHSNDQAIAAGDAWNERHGRAAGRSVLMKQTVLAVVAAGIVLLAINAYIASVATLGMTSALISSAIYTTVGAIVLSRIMSFHPHRVFGWPNTVTLSRAVLAALVAGYTAEISLWAVQPSVALATTFAVLASVAVALDGLDGWLARRVGPRSAFGARFDMESDALLIMILSVLAVVLGKAGFWILMIGGLRYAFVGASYLFAWIDRPLPPSFRRKVVCVVQGVVLCVLAFPVVSGPVGSVLGAIALGANILSFGVDLVWLHRHRHDAVTATAGGT